MYFATFICIPTLKLAFLTLSPFPLAHPVGMRYFHVHGLATFWAHYNLLQTYTKPSSTQHGNTNTRQLLTGALPDKLNGLAAALKVAGQSSPCVLHVVACIHLHYHNFAMILILYHHYDNSSHVDVFAVIVDMPNLILAIQSNIDSYSRPIVVLHRPADRYSARYSNNSC